MSKYCTSCGASLREGARFCDECGQPTQSSRRSGGRGRSQGSSNTLVIILVAVGAIVTLLFIVLGALFLFSKPKDDPIGYELPVPTSEQSSPIKDSLDDLFDKSNYLSASNSSTSQTLSGEKNQPETQAQAPSHGLKPGDVISMGMFDMDSDPDKEKIWWRVLDVQNNMALIVTRDGIDCRRFQSQDGAVTWGDSELRAWLNGDFYMGAFSMEEYNRITVSRVEYYDHNLDTYEIGDRIFLLSLGEVLSYFEDTDDRICHASELAVNKGAYVNPDTNGSWWWLRDSGDSASKIASINSDGVIDFDGGSAKSGAGVVRPAMWVFVG